MAENFIPEFNFDDFYYCLLLYYSEVKSLRFLLIGWSSFSACFLNTSEESFAYLTARRPGTLQTQLCRGKESQQAMMPQISTCSYVWWKVLLIFFYYKHCDSCSYLFEKNFLFVEVVSHKIIIPIMFSMKFLQSLTILELLVLELIEILYILIDICGLRLIFMVLSTK